MDTTALGSRKRWRLPDPVDPGLLSKWPEFDPVLVQLMANRGLADQDAADEFFNPDYGQDCHDPFAFEAMERAVARVIQALQKKEKIVVYGDYDADGVCGAACLWLTLRQLGAEPAIYIPYRQSEGYGLNVKAIDSIAQSGARLIITNDCGVTNVPEVDHANQLGLDVIICDHHHEPPVLPQAFAILNPHLESETYPFKDLCGTGVSFKLCQALLKKTDYGRLLDKTITVGWEKWLLDLLAIATVADMVPLLGENRTLVTYGLRVLNKTRRLGLLAMARAAQIDLGRADTETISYMLAPRLNVAGRLDHANSAFRLLVTDDQAEAEAIALELQRSNVERQQLTQQIVQEAIKQIGVLDGRMLIVAHQADWPVGVLGLAAGKLSEKFNRPAIVMGESNGEVSGSGRSIQAFNLIEALEKLSKYFTKYGGHPQACGFTLKQAGDRGAFIQALSALAVQQLADVDLTPGLTIDAVVGLSDVNWELLANVEKMSPYGQMNRRPVFVVQDVEVTNAQTVGRDGKHLRLDVRSAQGAEHRTIGFSLGEELAKLPVGRKIAIAFELKADEWNGERRLQLKIIDVHYHEDSHPEN